MGDHRGRTQGAMVVKVLEEYNIAHKFGCYVGDNATSNDNELIAGLHESDDLLNVTSTNRLRCAGHTINLVVKATLYGDVSKFEASLAGASSQQQHKLYRQYGVVGKLHNFVNSVCVSHKRRVMF